MVYSKELEDLLNQGFRYAWSLTHDGDDAFDLVQTSYLKLLEKGKPLVASYLVRTIRNLHIDQKRKEKLKISWINSKKNSAKSYEIKVSAEPCLEKALGTLPSSTREILFLSIVQEYSAREISDLLKIPRGTILSTIHRAKKKLNEVLKENEDGRIRR